MNLLASINRESMDGGEEMEMKMKTRLNKFISSFYDNTQLG